VLGKGHSFEANRPEEQPGDPPVANRLPAAKPPVARPVQNGTGQTRVIVFRNINGAQRLYQRQEIDARLRGRILPAPPFGR
jgi:hypothetical protein